MYGIAPRLPMTVSKEGAPGNTLTIEENTQQNLKNLLLTSPGERIMDLDFGVGIRRFLFENNTPTARSRIESRIYEQVSKYLPFVEINLLQLGYNDENPHLVDVKLRYDIANVASDQILSLSLEPKITS